MNAQDLAKSSSFAVRCHAGSVSLIVLEKLQIAYVAQWLYDQDESVLSAAATTAMEAIKIIKARYV